MPPSLYDYLMQELDEQDPQSGWRVPFCSCGRKGFHENTPECPQEGASYANDILYDVEFNPTVLAYRFEDDPVGMALLEAHIRLIADSRALHVAHQLHYLSSTAVQRDLREAVKKEKEKATAAVTNYNQMSTQYQSAQKLYEEVVLENRALKQKLEESTRRWRAIVEEVAIHIGLIKPGQPWSPGTLLRDMELQSMKENDGQGGDRGKDPAPGDGAGVLHAGQARPEGDVPVPGPRQSDPRWSVWRHRRAGLSGEG